MEERKTVIHMGRPEREGEAVNAVLSRSRRGIWVLFLEHFKGVKTDPIGIL